MSRSNYDKPFYVDIGTSIAAVRCASDREVVFRLDHVRLGKYAIDEANRLCDRLNAEVKRFIVAQEVFVCPACGGVLVAGKQGGEP